MLEVYPIQEKAEQEKLCKLCNIKYDVEKLAYSGYVKGEFVGVLQFGIHGDCGYIYDLENVIGVDNKDVLFVMGRAALNFIDLCGVKKAYFKANVDNREDLVKLIGFSKTPTDEWFIDLNGFFDAGHCCCSEQ